MNEKNENPWLIGMVTSILGSVTVSLLFYSINGIFQWYWSVIALTSCLSGYLFFYNLKLRATFIKLSTDLASSKVIFSDYKVLAIPYEGMCKTNDAIIRNNYIEFSQLNEGILYGPYITLPDGFYKVTFSMKIDDIKFKENQVMIIDVASRMGKKIWAWRNILEDDFKLIDNYIDMNLYFNLENASIEDKWEFRLYVTQNTESPRRIALNKISIYRK